MSLSEQNRALIEREWGDKIFREGFQQKGARVYPKTLDRLLDAARAEGVAALQQAGEHVAEVGNLIDLPTGPVAWARSTVIRDRDGYAIGSDEPEVHWGPTYPEDETGWLPLFALPQQTALVDYKGLGPHEPDACGASAPSEPPLSAEEVELPNYWRAVVGDTYKPAVLRNVKHMHPATVKEVFDRYAGTDVADVIAGLIFKNQIANNRSEFFAEEYAKATASPPPPADGGEG